MARAAKELSKYRSMRNFGRTPEPAGAERLTRAKIPRFVVQKHAARRLHYDFRLEVPGSDEPVLASWAIPKGPSLDPSERRLAMQTEDHPLDYFDFEGVIPEGNYGAGEVIVWDMGTYDLLEGDDPRKAIERGKIKLRLHGKKLSGGFTLVKMHGRSPKDNAWLLIKERDDAVDPRWGVEAAPKSVKTGRTLEDVAKDPHASTWGEEGERAVPVIAEPMLATLIDGPFDDPNWLFEVKWDGIRAILTVAANGDVTMISRRGNDLLDRFPELRAVGKAFRERPVVVDGEIVSLDAEGKSSFQRLQGHMRRKIPIQLVVFDLLFVNGRDLRPLGCEARKAELERILRAGTANVLYSKHVTGEGNALFAFAREHGLEGIIAKRRDAPYREKRTRDWLKIKVKQQQECVIGGYTEPGGSRKGFGALLLGLYDGGALHYVGQVGTGFDQITLADLSKRFHALETNANPFTERPHTRRPAHWLHPELVAQIEFSEWTNDGSMRHPVYLGLRDDKAPEECVREVPVSATSAKKKAPRPRARGGRS